MTTDTNGADHRASPGPLYVDLANAEEVLEHGLALIHDYVRRTGQLPTLPHLYQELAESLVAEVVELMPPGGLERFWAHIEVATALATAAMLRLVRQEEI